MDDSRLLSSPSLLPLLWFVGGSVELLLVTMRRREGTNIATPETVYLATKRELEHEIIGAS